MAAVTTVLQILGYRVEILENPPDWGFFEIFVFENCSETLLNFYHERDVSIVFKGGRRRDSQITVRFTSESRLCYGIGVAFVNEDREYAIDHAQRIILAMEQALLSDQWEY
jgi:hypothetical protein